jgi:hypothetical protein
MSGFNRALKIKMDLKHHLGNNTTRQIGEKQDEARIYMYKMKLDSD